MIDACRALRGEMGLSPAQKIPLIAAQLSSAGRERLHAYAPALRALARIDEVRIVTELPPGAKAPVQIVGDSRLMLDVPIDLAAERDRLQKEIQRLQGEINKAQTKLSNPSFVERAPAPVVQQERKRVADFELAMTRVQEQLAQLD